MLESRRLLLVSIDGLAAPYLEDPSLELPTLRGLLDRGAGAARVATPLPGVTWPCHTSLITGAPPARHGVLGNAVFDRRDRTMKEHMGDRAYDKDEVVTCPTLYDLAHAAGQSTAAVCWPQTRGARTLDFHVPEALDQPIFDRYATPALWADLRRAGLPVQRYAAWSDTNVLSPMQDRLTTDVTCHLIARHRPELLLVHYLALDCYQHDFGPASPEAWWALRYVDQELGRVLDALARADLVEPTAIVVTSDHGFTATETRIAPNVWLRRQGLLEIDAAGRPAACEAFAAGNGGVACVTVLRDELRPRLAKELGELPGVEQVVEGAELTALGLPAPGSHPHAPDLLLVAAPDAYFARDEAAADEPVGPAVMRGTHGHPARGPWLHTTAIAAGPGVAAGARVENAELTAVGATAAALLGFAFPSGAAAPLRSLLAD
jgi:type I phosphodiesterase/nucleotide pyrophosphatase